MTEQRTPPPAFPHKQVSAGALFLNESSKILLVNPTYKPPWEIPGGMVEADEAPMAACQREVLEEIGLAVAPVTLLSVGYLRAHSNRGDSVRFIFWGGVLDAATIAQIQLQATELSEYRFVTLAEAAALVRPSLHAQLGQCLTNLAINANGAIPHTYWEEV